MNVMMRVMHCAPDKERDTGHETGRTSAIPQLLTYATNGARNHYYYYCGAVFARSFTSHHQLPAVLCITYCYLLLHTKCKLCKSAC